ncbi:hypothetical protein BGX34_005136 [Mortierella sp. NVP85]|nr:hypothetical protein BGX34_005136 [Mortierella sp. NVP85]
MESTSTRAPRPLPSELLGSIFQYLLPSDLLCCLVVSREWHTEGVPFLYSHATFRADTPPSVIEIYKSNKHYIRYLALDVSESLTVSEEDILDILLDYQIPKPVGDSNTHTAIELGLRRPALRSFSFSGRPDYIARLDDIVLNFTSLTCLSLNYRVYYGGGTTNPLSLGRILETMPQLIDLSILVNSYESLTPDSPLLEPNAPLYRLRTFGFGVELITCPEPMLRFFRRLGNLVSVKVHSGYIRPEYMSNRRSEAISQALSKFCPKLQKIERVGEVPFHLYSFPSSLTTTETTEATETTETPPAPIFMPLVRYHTNDREEHLFIEEQLRGQFEEAFEYFPNLTTVIITVSDTFSAEDLRCLAVRAKHLTHVDLAGSYRSAWRSTAPMLLRNGRHRVTGLDVQVFLETCPRLKVFRTFHSIHFKEILPPDAAILSNGTVLGLENGLEGSRFAKPWACEGTLEVLKVGFEMVSATPWHHRIVFAQLGRCRRLKSLALSPSSLIPTLKHGMDLLEGLQETLEEVPLWSSAIVFDDKETVLWVLDKFKKLTKMGTNAYEGSSIQEQMMEWVPPEQRDRLEFILRPRVR